MKSQEVNCQKSQKLLASRAGSSKQTIAGPAFTYPAIEIEWIAIESSEEAASVELARWAVSAIFEKLPFVIKPHFSPFWSEKILCFSDILIKRY